MPPRYAYWTIIVDDQPTAFRSASVDELMPTFNRLQAKHPNAVLKWFQNGKLWDSRLDAREAQERRGERGRKFDRNQQRGSEERAAGGKLEWKARKDRPKLEWSPRPGPSADRPDKRARSPMKPGGFRRDSGRADSKRREKPRENRERQKLEWSPRPTAGGSSPETRGRKPFKPAARPDERPRDSKWRPGGDHRDPRQKYKDAKKAKWTRFKQAIGRRRDPRRKP